MPLLPGDRSDLIATRLWLGLLRDNINTLSDEQPETSREAQTLGEVGSRLNPVLVALDKVLEPE